VNGNSILTASGIYFSYTDPLPGQIFLSDIATSLGNTCRFTGHCHFYSVAEHCVHAAMLAHDMDLMRHALMHDAAEAYTGDLTPQLKNMLPGFRDLEHTVEAAILGRFGMIGDRYDEVKILDMMMLKAEKKFLFPDDLDEWNLEDVPSVYVDIKCWPPGVATCEFLDLAEKLGIEET